MRVSDFYNNLIEFYNLFRDALANAWKFISYPHAEIHGGRGFLAVYSALKDNAGFIEVRFRPNHATRRCHTVIIIDTALAATVELWRSTTKTHVSANEITPINRDFASPNQSVMNICHTPAGAQAGTADLLQYIGSATANGKSTIGGGTESRGEFILKPFHDYLIKVTSRANSNALTIFLDWYEHTDR